jgi:hypothetical protein
VYACLNGVSDQKLISLSGATGAKNWELPLHGVAWGSPLLDDGGGNVHIIIGAFARVFRVRSDGTGGDYCKVGTNYIFGSPAMIGRSVFVGSRDGNMCVEAGVGRARLVFFCLFVIRISLTKSFLPICHAGTSWMPT